MHKEGKVGLIDKQGTVVAPCIYDMLSGLAFTDPFYEQELAIAKKDEKCGLLSKDGKEITPCIYDYIGGFKDKDKKIVGVEKDEKKGLVNTDGKEIVPCIYESIDDFNDDGIAQACKDGKYGLIDVKGNTTFIRN